MLKKISLLLIFQTLFCFYCFGAEVSVQKGDEGGWRLLVNGRDYFIRGVDYRITRIGESPDNGTLQDWAYYDFNRNGKWDGPYDAWVDKNRNNRQDSDEPPVGDFHLMKEMGANTIRWYVNDFKNQKANKKLLRDLFHRYGIRVAVGNKFGAYTIDSGASWSEGTDYRNKRQKLKMLESVKRMVLEHKDEPYTLIWLLGNENNYPFTNTNASQYPKAYALFLNQASQLIHQLDGKHPVAIVNGDTKLIDYYKKYCPDVDIFGVNVYRGPNGFGSLWTVIKSTWDKPILITEYGGSDAAEYGEETQSRYHRNAWLDIQNNRFGAKGERNGIGGFAFEWLDEWWKAGKPYFQAPQGTKGKVGLDTLNWSQEHCGIMSQGTGRHSPFLRQIRPVYFMYQELWRKKENVSKSGAAN